ncbi:MAG: Gfo/Idh/MocA family oxidoreductase [Verrucomicrobia bacterium]|nr:Gfo/Idh/MocA family oxidoreductase [Verrucomicrobiota bacterium]MCG2680273.1 Gfo/Idh/MocA family oxidoreductase [Kiritimatiellia bacterium]MCG2818909.1 Gfo/Idh/MocA family oxidoreductase [Actinomycetes bacterium]MBU4247403.1 Gfo/Idh/MocA family oxidoreductase [Verrucomicrobiota bacterium]MBU4290502.1 Gfo/Idh/MocA family oxidoreductase [Verrucomicrobiota bacterium]
MAIVKWLLVGAGEIANNRVAPSLAAAANSEIVAICDTRAEAAAALAKKFGVNQIYGDFEQALAESGADAVYLATPVALHVPHGLRVLESGKHLLVEKPLGLNATECQRLASAAQGSNKLAGCAYYRRHSEYYKFTKTMVENGEFGQIVGGYMNYFVYHKPDKSALNYWTVVREKAGGGLLCHLGSHILDIFIGLFDLPLSVCAQCGTLTNDWNIEDCAAIIIKLRNGALVTANFNWNSMTPVRHELEILGTRAKVSWGWPHDSEPLLKTVGHEVQKIEIQKVNNFGIPLVQDFVDAVLHNRQPLCTVAEAFKTSVLTDAIYRSAAEGREVKVIN